MQVIKANWPLGAEYIAFTTTRLEGESDGDFASLNTGFHVGDDPEKVAANRAKVLSYAAAEYSQWLDQVHGTHCVSATQAQDVTADACWTDRANLACVVMTADCLPVVFACGERVAAAHAGWRGLLNGILESSLAHLDPALTSVWLGPAIGPLAFEVGPEVREQFIDKSAQFAPAFKNSPNEGKWLADIYALARLTLVQSGVAAASIYGGDLCTYTDSERFFSYRRGTPTGRMATVICRRKSHC
ncbi:MAG: peptidoglycan editing factor PgeF [Pseudomonadales bacterium]